MSDNAELHSKILGFLAGEFARKEGRQCVRVDLDFSPGNGFKDESIRKWVRADEPELFDNFANVEKLVAQIIEIAEGEADAKPPGKHRFVVRTHQHMNDRATLSFALSPQYTGGSDETALAPNGAGVGSGGYRQDVIANHAGQLMRINAQMFEGTIRVLGAQNQTLHTEVAELRVENNKLRRENDEMRLNSNDRDYQIAMAMEKNKRVNAGFQQALQLASVVVAKIGGIESPTGAASPLARLINDFGRSLRQDQIGVLMGLLDMSQKLMFMEIMNAVAPPEQPGSSKPGGSALPPTGGANGASS